MKFLKIVIAIANTILLVIVINNMLGFMFPSKSLISTGSSSNCNGILPSYSEKSTTDPVAYKEQQTKYDSCLDAERQKTEDERALRSQAGLIRGVVVLVTLIILAALLFKKYPFFSSSLILAGIIIVLIYPLYLNYGDMILSSKNVSSAVQQQVKLTKFIVSLLGAVSLTLGDLLFFEKHRPMQTSQNGQQERFQPPVSGN